MSRPQLHTTQVGPTTVMVSKSTNSVHGSSYKATSGQHPSSLCRNEFLDGNTIKAKEVIVIRVRVRAPLRGERRGNNRVDYGVLAVFSFFALGVYTCVLALR